jgi:hypothetical protein
MKDLKRYFNRWELERIEAFEEEGDLIDGCKYILYIKEQYREYKDESSFPVRSIKEAKQFLKDYSI